MLTITLNHYSSTTPIRCWATGIHPIIPLRPSLQKSLLRYDRPGFFLKLSKTNPTTDRKQTSMNTSQLHSTQT